MFKKKKKITYSNCAPYRCCHRDPESLNNFPKATQLPRWATTSSLILFPLLYTIQTLVPLCYQEQYPLLRIKWHSWSSRTEGLTGKQVSHFSCSVLSDSLRPLEPQHARPPCPSPTPGVYPNSYPLSQWCHPTISSSVVPFSFCPQYFPASGSFQMSQLFAWGGQSIGVSASTSVLLMHTQDWPPLGWTGWISLQSKGLSRVFSNRKTNLTPYWICSLAITLVLYCLCLVMLVLYLLLKNVAYSMKYTR